MKITIEIVDRNYFQIDEFCKFNNIQIEDYIVQCVEDDFFTRKYGDLNEKLGINKEEAPKVEEKPKEVTEKKKVGRPRKKKVETESPTLIPETIEKGPNPPIIINSWEEFYKLCLDKKEENKEQPKITKRTRILKSK